MKDSLFILLCLVFCSYSTANSSVADLSEIFAHYDAGNLDHVENISSPFALEDYMLVLVDKNGSLGIDDIIQKKGQAFSKLGTDPLDNDATYWLKIQLKGNNIYKADYLFILSSDVQGLETWDKIETHLVSENGNMESFVSGNDIRRKDKTIPSTLNLALYTLAKNEPATLYVKYQGISLASLKLRQKLNVFVDKKESFPGAFSNYHFAGDFKKHDSRNKYNYLYNHEIYVETTTELDIQHISQNWESLQTYSASEILQKADEVYWLKTTIKGNPYLVGQQLFQVSSRSTHYYTFDKIDTYVLRNNGDHEHLVTGEGVAQNARAFNSWATIIPIDFESNDSLDIFFRLQGGLAAANMGQILIKHIDKDTFLTQQVNQGIISGLFFGVFCVLGLIFLLLYFMDTEAINFYLFLMVIGVILALTVGDPDRHFNMFPSLRKYAVYAWCFGGVLMSVSFLKFTEQYFSYDKSYKVSKYWIPLIVICSFTAAFIDARFLIDYSKYTNRLSFISHLMQIVAIIMAIFMAYNALSKRANSKRFYAIAFLPVAVCVALTLSFLILGRIPKLENIAWIQHMYEQVLKNGSNIVRINLIISLCLFALSMGNRTNILKADQKLLRDIEEKNKSIVLLLKEIHHRVKNNLEIISSLLELQSNQITDTGAKLALEASQSRVNSMAIIHQKLYQGKDISSIKMKEYFKELVEGTLYNYGMQDLVTFNCEMEELEMDVEHAIPIGLISNELITNSLKYAFSDHTEPIITIRLEKYGSQEFRLIVADNGTGNTHEKKGSGFGTQLIGLLVQQLDGSLYERVTQGTHFEITFR